MNPMIYGTHICRDRYCCGGLTVTVLKEANCYSWTISEELQFKFPVVAYEKVFSNYLKDWKKAKNGKHYY